LFASTTQPCQKKVIVLLLALLVLQTDEKILAKEKDEIAMRIPMVGIHFMFLVFIPKLQNQNWKLGLVNMER